MHAAIYFVPDAYLLDGPKLMGRQSAGNGFLRAAVKAHAGEPIRAVTPIRASAETFAQAVTALDPKAKPVWIPASRLDRIAEAGVLYRPDLNLAVPARERLRVGPARYSLCGVTHTLSSHGSADSMADLITGPVMPWDALICTSSVARSVAETTLHAQVDYLAWRIGAPVAIHGLQLPVIPLGVHCEDFAFGADARAAARQALDLAEDEVVALFAGRLSFSGKAHPFQTLRGLEAAAARTGRKVVFLMAGRFASKGIEDAFRAAPKAVCPNVKVVFVDGKDDERFVQAWRAADLFLSISDNYQETFGITPLEAMAAGLPVVVSDWDGYKDTVRDGEDGFRIPTWAPQAGVGETIAADYETFVTNYDFYISRSSTTVSVDPRILAERLSALIADADLRRRMGQAGAARARAVFDWSVVYRQYQSLWSGLSEIRARRGADPALRLARAPRAAPTRLDPFRAFAAYPTRHIGPQTRVCAAEGAGPAAYQALTAQSLLSFWTEPPERIERIFAALAGDTLTVADLAAGLGEPMTATLERIARLAKMELVELLPADDPPGAEG